MIVNVDVLNMEFLSFFFVERYYESCKFLLVVMFFLYKLLIF